MGEGSVLHADLVARCQPLSVGLPVRLDISGIQRLAAGRGGASCFQFEALGMRFDQVTEFLEAVQAWVEGGAELADVGTEFAELHPVIFIIGNNTTGFS